MDKDGWFTIILITGFILLSFIKCEIAKRCSEPDYYFTTGGEEYHLGECPEVNEYNVEESFESKEDAEDAGYKPCRWCIENKSEETEDNLPLP